jgi:hypothetical protein
MPLVPLKKEIYRMWLGDSMIMSANQNNKGEAFSITPDGRKVDGHIHWPILDNEEADAVLDDEHLRRLEEGGYSKEHIDLARKAIEEKRKKAKQARGGFDRSTRR